MQARMILIITYLLGTYILWGLRLGIHLCSGYTGMSMPTSSFFTSSLLVSMTVPSSGNGSAMPMLQNEWTKYGLLSISCLLFSFNTISCLCIIAGDILLFYYVIGFGLLFRRISLKYFYTDFTNSTRSYCLSVCGSPYLHWKKAIEYFSFILCSKKSNTDSRTSGRMHFILGINFLNSWKWLLFLTDISDWIPFIILFQYNSSTSILPLWAIALCRIRFCKLVNLAWHFNIFCLSLLIMNVYKKNLSNILQMPRYSKTAVTRP